MPDKVTTPGLLKIELPEGANPDQVQRAKVAVRISLVGAALGFFSIGLYVLVYIQTGAWQVLADAGLVVLAIVCLLPAGALARKGKLEPAGYWILAAIFLAYGGGTLVWANTAIYNAVGGVLLIFLVGSMIRPRRWRLWLAIAVLYLAVVALADWLNLLPRYDVMQSFVLRIHVPLVTAALVLLTLWQVVRVFSTGTIRTRLLVASVGATLLPVITVGIALLVLGVQNERQRVSTHLESVAILKENEVNLWAQDLKSDLALALAGDILTPQAITLLHHSTDPAMTQLTETVLRTHLTQVLQQTGRFEEFFMLDLQGTVVLSTDVTHEGEPHGNDPYFREGLRGPYVQRPYYSTSDLRVFQFVAMPVKSVGGQVEGVVAGRASLTALNQIMMERTGLGETGETYLAAAGTLLTPNREGRLGFYALSPGIDRVLGQHLSGAGLYDNYAGQAVVGAYRWLPDLQVGLVAEQSQGEALSQVYVMLAVLGGIALFAMLAAIVASLFLVRGITNPLAHLADTAGRIAAGDLHLDAQVVRADEIGTLSRSFNAMTAQLRDLIGSLEQRVADRTQELERRSSYLEAAADVSRAAASILDADELMRRAVEQIAERFDLYYVGLFLVDEEREWGVLRANAGRTGRSLPQLGQRLAIGSSSMVGWSIANAQARVALEAAVDAVRLAQPDLPDTRSEAALPLRSRGQVIGALSVQHTALNAFDQDTVVVLQTMADQVAVALDNARLFAEREQALEATHRAFGELSQQAWAEILHSKPVLGYRSDERGISVAGETWRPEMIQALQTGQTVRGNQAAASSSPAAGSSPAAVRPLAVPIKIRGQVIGVLDTYKPAGTGDWTEGEIALLEAIADQLDSALEGARLYQDTQRRAAREQAIRHVTEHMRRAVDIEAILQSTVTELARALGAPRAFVRLGTELKPGAGDGDSGS